MGSLLSYAQNDFSRKVKPGVRGLSYKLRLLSLWFFKDLRTIMCINVLPACMYVCHMCLVSMEVRGSLGSPRYGVTEVGELSSGGWDSNPAPLQEHQALFITESPLLLSEF